MGNLFSSNIILDIEKDINIELHTNIENKFKNKTFIKNYVKNNIEDMGSSMYDYISNYLYIKKISIKRDNTIKFDIKFKINKKGKTIRAHSGNKLNENKLKEYITLNELKAHIRWSLNEAAIRAEPLKLKEGEFSIKNSDINNIILLN